MEFIFLQIIIGMTAIDTLSDLVKRSQLVRCAILVFIAYSISYLGYTLLSEGDWIKINWNMFAYFGGSCILLLFAYLLIYLLEKTLVCIKCHISRTIRYQFPYSQAIIRNMPRNVPTFDASI